MLIKCETCGAWYDDVNRWTICPHNPLEAGANREDFCFRHDMFGPCPICAMPPVLFRLSIRSVTVECACGCGALTTVPFPVLNGETPLKATGDENGITFSFNHPWWIFRFVAAALLRLRGIRGRLVMFESVDGRRFRLSKPAVLMSRGASFQTTDTVDLTELLQSANAGNSQSVETPEKSANT